ncbi:MAG: hypothetical protein WBC21_00125 [Minisyncoccales bacterium]
MALFYKREETSDEIIIRYKYYSLFYIILIVGLILSISVDEITGASWGYLIWALIFIFLLAFLVDIRKPNKEIRRAMKEGSVQISGSRFSFSNPFTAVIKKV